jgi:hypothetical protein
MKDIGIVFDCNLPVGNFDLKNNNIVNLSINSNYIDLITGKFNRKLDFLLVEKSENKYKMIKNVGRGDVVGNYFISNNIVNYTTATLIKDDINLNGMN